MICLHEFRYITTIAYIATSAETFASTECVWIYVAASLKYKIHSVLFTKVYMQLW